MLFPCRNIAQLTDEVSYILDTPSKAVLWSYLLPRMTSDHIEYVNRYVQLLPQKQLPKGVLPSNASENIFFDIEAL